jgi:hypothetical protein
MRVPVGEYAGYADITDFSKSEKGAWGQAGESEPGEQAEGEASALRWRHGQGDA